MCSDDYTLHETDWEEFLRKGRESYGLTAADHVDSSQLHGTDLHGHGECTEHRYRSIRVSGCVRK